MPFKCPQCLQPCSLEILHSIQLPPDSRSDDITLQVVACSGCGFKGLAVYEESRRGALDSELWEHTGYYGSQASIEEISRIIELCPAPGDVRCTCPAHRKLGKLDERGRWVGPETVQPENSFPMDLYQENKSMC